MDYLLLVKLDASRRFREYLSVGDRCFLTNLLPPLRARRALLRRPIHPKGDERVLRMHPGEAEAKFLRINS